CSTSASSWCNSRTCAACAPRSFRGRSDTTMCGSRNEQHSLLRVHGALTAVAILFSSTYVISKLAMTAFSPMSFAYLRVVGAAIVLSALTAREPSPRLRGEGRVRGDLGRITLYSILGVALKQCRFLAGQSLTS